ncbi:MAG: dihydrodipicolinate synthase family protein [Acidobacteriaceae bacterium]
MKTRKLSGVIPPVGTPLTAEGAVDVPGLRRLTKYLLDAGCHGLFANGSMSGFAFLSDREQSRAIATVVETAEAKVPVMAGLGEMSTTRAVQRAREIASLGVTHITLLSPIFYIAQQEHLIRYFSDIAAAVDLPIVLYDNPVLTKNPIHPETILELRQRVPNLVGVKESNQDCVNLQRLLDLTKGDESFSVLTGSEFLIVVGLQMGVDGCVGGVHNICPRVAVDLYEAFVQGDLAAAHHHQRMLTEIWQIFTYGNVWGGYEEALRYLGICERAAGEPYVTALTDGDKAAVRAILSRHLTPASMLS